MSNTDLISINLIIADRPYPLKVKPEEEDVVRQAAKQLNEKIKDLQQQYSAKDKQDYLAMCALMNETEIIAGKKKVTITDPAFFEKLQELDAQLSETVSS